MTAPATYRQCLDAEVAVLEAGAKAGAALDACLMWGGEQFTLVIGAGAPEGDRE